MHTELVSSSIGSESPTRAADKWPRCVYERQKTKHYIGLSFVVLTMVFWSTPAATAKEFVLRKHKGIVVLDPGHGGNDTGARGPEGILEKAVTLTLARMIENGLENEYRVVLTRTEDYWLDIANRTAVANHLNADLFISLHTGGSFQHSVGGTSIFYFKEFSEPALTFEKPTLDALTSNDSPTPWNQIQSKYLTSSKSLAEIIRAHMSRITQDPNSNIQGAPLLVLEGADMPAVLIEFGYLTHPNEGKALGDKEFLTLIANAISKGIEDYFRKKAK